VQAKKRSPTPSAANSGSRPPDPLTLFLDESLDSVSVANALRDAGATVVRHTEQFPRGIADDVWLTYAGENNWVVITRDKRIRYRQLERLALQAAKVRAFVFTGGNVTAADTGSILSRALDRIHKICQINRGPFIYHIGRSGKPLKMI